MLVYQFGGMVGFEADGEGVKTIFHFDKVGKNRESFFIAADRARGGNHLAHIADTKPRLSHNCAAVGIVLTGQYFK